MAASRTKAITLAGSPATHTHVRAAKPERRRDPRGDRYDHAGAFDPRTDLSKAVRGKRGPIETAAVAVDDPWTPGGRSLAAVNRRVDVLEMERSHGRLTVSQYEVGRQVQAIFERASGARLGSMDFGVRGSKDMTIAHELSVILLGFAAALRRSELVALDVADLERVPDGIIVHVRRSKTDQEGAGQEIAVPRGAKLKPCEALEAWLKAAGITAGPVFRSVGKGGAVSAERLTDRSVADIVKRHAAAAGLDASLFSGHSLRAGFVTSALAAGADVLKVMHVTRHTAVTTLQKYDRRARAFDDHAGKRFL